MCQGGGNWQGERLWLDIGKVPNKDLASSLFLFFVFFLSFLFVFSFFFSNFFFLFQHFGKQNQENVLISLFPFTLTITNK